MSKDIVIKKGLDIRLQGEAKKSLDNAVPSNFYSIGPEDFHGVVPKLLVKEGSTVQAGEPLFFNKTDERVKFAAPVSGEIVEIKRGEKRRILSIKIKADKEQSYKNFGITDVANASPETIKGKLLESGCWPFIKQRPYDIIAKVDSAPKAIFISGFSSAPLATDIDFVLQGKQAELQVALTALAKLTKGKVHVSIAKKSSSIFEGMKDIALHRFSGPHPAGNVGTQINKIDPVNKGEVVWTVAPQDLVIIGELLLTGHFNTERVLAMVGSSVKEPRYFKTKLGAEVASIIYDKGIEKDAHVRIVSGNVLTGKKVSPDGYLDFYSNIITIIPEGDDYQFFGWLKPEFNKISPSRALTFSWLHRKKRYNLDTNTNGEHRAFVVTGSYEEVFPLDMYPLQILKSCMYRDLDEMEALGMYEVAPEDFALTEFICVSKQPHQKIIRDGLDLMIKEIG